MPLLHDAAQNNNAGEIDRLLAGGAEVNSTDSQVSHPSPLAPP